ncbi:MAG: hypothetical protein PWP23_1908 [Candidatus Sumerlaeota bacterium]|nr:hypothetical protein [Candidatus Sumerlaeota bacterium]
MAGIVTRSVPGGKQSQQAALLFALFFFTLLLSAGPVSAQPGWSDDMYGDPLTIETAPPDTVGHSSAPAPVSPPQLLPRVGLVRLGPVDWNWSTMERELRARSSRSIPGLMTILEEPGTPFPEFLASRGDASSNSVTWLGVSPPGGSRGVLFNTDGKGVIAVARPMEEGMWQRDSQALSLDSRAMGRSAARRVAQAWNGSEGVLLLRKRQPPPSWADGLIEEMVTHFPQVPLRVLTLDASAGGTELADIVAVNPEPVGLIIVASDEEAPAWIRALDRETSGIDLVAVGEAAAFRPLVESGTLAGWVLPNYGRLLDPVRASPPPEDDPEAATWFLPSNAWAERLRRASFREQAAQ